MRIVLCDDDVMMLPVVSDLIGTLGHEIAGVADTTAAAVGLIEHASPDVVIIDLSLGYNTDFDPIETAIAVGAKTIVFSNNADRMLLSRYSPEPTVVVKPDVAALRRALERLDAAAEAGAVEVDRRGRPARAAEGPTPTGISDSAAFYEALNRVHPGDALVAIDAPEDSTTIAATAADLIRETDRLLASSSAVMLLLPAAGDEGITAFVARLREVEPSASDARVRSIVVADGETGTDAFERLRRTGSAEYA